MISIMTNTDPILAKAIARLEEARKEAASWEDWIARYNSIASDAGSTLAVLKAPPHGARHMPPANQKSDVVVETLNASRSVIMEANRPVPLRELLVEMAQRGIEIGGKKPAATLDSRLRYSKEFRNIAGRGWWIIDLGLPQPNGSAADTHKMSAAQEDRT
jgi:hypothetical protein